MDSPFAIAAVVSWLVAALAIPLSRREVRRRERLFRIYRGLYSLIRADAKNESLSLPSPRLVRHFRPDAILMQIELALDKTVSVKGVGDADEEE